MAGGVGQKELARRGRVTLKVEEDTIDMRLGMVVFALGYGRGVRGIAIDELECISGQFAQVAPDGLVGAVNRSVEGRVVEIDPILFAGFETRLNDGILRESKIVRIS